MKKQSYAVLSAAITATLLGGVVPAWANDAVVTVDKTKTTDEKSVEAQQQGVYQAVSQLMTHSDKAVAVNADAAVDTAAVVAEKAADDTTTSTNKTAVDNNGFYVKNGLMNSYNSLTDMGLWIGGTDAKTGFRVDTAGNVNTTGDVSANAITAKQFLAVGSTDGSLVNAAFGVDGSGNVTMNGALNGFTFTQDGTWTDHYGFQDQVDMINGIGFGQVGTLNEGTLFVKDLVVNSFQSSGMTGGYVYLADGSAEKNNGMSTAIGGSSAIWGDNSVAIGFDADVEMNMEPPETDENGNPYEEGNPYPGYQGTAIGAYAKVAAQNGSAFGYHAEVFQENGVALGSQSTVAEGDMNVVSVGHKAGDPYLGGALLYDSDLFRRITNVAAGVNPEDAVTVGQLKDNKDLATSGIAKWDEASNGASMNGVLNGVTLKNGNVTATDLTVKTINGKAADKLANVDEVDTIIGHSVSKPETFILKNGGLSLIDGINSNTALIEKNATSITNITDGLKTAFAGVDFKKLQEISKVDTKSLIAPTSYSLSLASTVPTSALLAEGDRPAPGEGSDSGTVTRPQPGTFDSVNVGGDLAVSGSATVSKDLTVNGTSNLNGNVNVGKDLTVTGKTNLKGDTKVDGKLTIKDGDKTMDVAAAINKNQTAITEQNKAISTLGQGLSSLGKEVDSVGAISAALAGLHPLDYNGNSKFQLSAAVGTYDGTQAMAFGGFYHANPNVLLSLGASTSFGGERKTAGNFGVTFRVGSGVSESPTVADNAALQDKLQKQQDQLTAQQKEIEELKAMVQNLTK